MSRMRAVARKWGSSVAVVLPPEAVRAEGIKPGDAIEIEVRRAQTLRDLFGSLRGWQVDPMDVKRETRQAEKAREKRLK